VLYDGLDIVKTIKIGRLRWLGHVLGMQRVDPRRNLTLLKPEGTRHVGKLRLRWFESVEEDLKNMELETQVTGPRTLEDNFGSGEGPPRTVTPEVAEGEGACM
jgi:hypothetical protein